MFEDLIELFNNQLKDIGEINFGQMPDYPDDVININFSAGNSPIFSINSLQPMIRQPAIQIVTRGLDYTATVTKLNECMETLMNYVGPLGSSHQVMSISSSSDILPLGRDKQNRYLFSINIVLKIH